jgi:hypothetical protein
MLLRRTQQELVLGWLNSTGSGKSDNEPRGSNPGAADALD